MHTIDGDSYVYPARVLLQGMVLFKEALSQWSPTRHNPDNGKYENLACKDKD